MNVIFLGTPQFAVPTLEALAGAGHAIQAVFTQPDRPQGRGNKNLASPVKQTALRLGVPVHQPESIRHPEVVEQIGGLKPDAMVVVGYGQIIPQSIIDIPALGIINVHASLLPKYRGAAVFGEQRGVYINDAQRRNVDDRLRDDLAVADHDHGVGLQAADLFDHFGAADALGLVNRDVESKGGLLDG